MCQGCFNQLFLRDEFHTGGMAGLLGKAAGMPTRRAFMAYSVAAASALSAVGAAPAFAADEGADLILRGGTIRPLPGAPVASALAIKGGQVLAVGDESALSGLKTRQHQGRRSCRPHAAAGAHRSALPHAPCLADLRTARRRRLRQISDPRKTRGASERGRGERAEGAMDRRLQFRQSSARRGFHAGATGCDFNRPADFRLVHQRPRRLRQQRSAENRRHTRRCRRSAGRRSFRPGRRRQAQRPGLRGKRDAQIRGPLPRQDHARGRRQGGHALFPAHGFRRQHDAARARHDPLGLDRAVRKALEYACLPHQRERDVRRHEGPDALAQPRPRTERRARLRIPCSRSMA